MIARNVGIGAVVMVLGTGAVVAPKALSGGGASSDKLVGVFTDASPLVPGSEVRIDGVQVGSITGISLKNGKAWVSTDINAASLPLHSNAQMTIKPVNLLGEDYIDITPGTDSTPMLSGAVIPASQTSSAVTLQQVLDTLDNPTSAGLAATIAALGQGLNDSGPQTADAIKALAPAMQNASQLGSVLSEQNAVLSDLLDKVGPVASSLAEGHGRTLDGIVASTEKMLSAIALQQDAAKATLEELPSTLASARRTLQALAGTSAATTPTLAALRPLTDNLSAVTGELNNFAVAAQPALSSLVPVLAHARSLLDAAAPVVAQLRTAGPAFESTTSRLQPLGSQLLSAHLNDLMLFVKKWALSTNGKDALSHYFRGVFHVTPQTLADLAAVIAPKSVTNLTSTVTGLVPGAKQLLPNLLGSLNLGSLGLGGLTQGLNNVLGGSPSGSGSASASGLSQPQEQSLLGQLLGGQ